MTANPCAIDADKPVAYAAKMMKDENVGFAPIVEGDRLVGTVTDRDIAVKAVAEGKDPQGRPRAGGGAEEGRGDGGEDLRGMTEVIVVRVESA